MGHKERLMQISVLLLVSLFWGSFAVWWRLIGRMRRQVPALEQAEGPRPRWRSIPEWIVALLALACVCLALKGSVNVREDAELMNPTMLIFQSAVPLGLAMALFLVLMTSDSPLEAYGLRLTGVGDQMRIGFLGFLAVVIPMAISIVAMVPFRNRDTQHALLRMLDGNPDPYILSAVALAAVVAAPVWEEFQFRVVLQGWLSTLIPPPLAIAVVALAFAMVHGWRDGLALIPLAVILGYVYHRQRSYLEVVVIHALFNATMLTLQLLIPQGDS